MICVVINIEKREKKLGCYKVSCIIIIIKKNIFKDELI